MQVVSNSCADSTVLLQSVPCNDARNAGRPHIAVYPMQGGSELRGIVEMPASCARASSADQ